MAKNHTDRLREALDSEDEELIRKAIEEKSIALGRRHHAVMYVNKSQKRKIFLQLRTTLCTRKATNL